MISRKSQAELEKMRHAGSIVGRALDATTAAVRPGVTTAELDRIAEAVIRGAGVEGALARNAMDNLLVD